MIRRSSSISIRAAPSGPEKTSSSSDWQDMPDMAAGIIVDDIGDLKITFSGEVWTSNNKRMFVRALVDGQPAGPSDVVFSVGGFTGTRSFTFIKKKMGSGGHWVRVQWRIDSGGTAYIGDRTLALYASSVKTKYGMVSVKAGPSGPFKTTKSPSWNDMPDMSVNIPIASSSNIEITFSGEVMTSDNKRMFVRALVDGQPAGPSDVVFSVGGFTGTRSFTFGKENLGPGNHQVQIQWTIDSGGTAYVGDRTLSVNCAPLVTKYGGVAPKVAPSGPFDTTASAVWVDIPDVSTNVATAENSDIEITFSGEAMTSDNKRMFVRALVDGQPAHPSDVVFSVGGFTGTRSFTFIKDNLGVGNHKIQIQWCVDSDGIAYLGDRTTSVNYWQGQVPNLNTPSHGLKPVIGTRRILVILWDPHRQDHPAPPKKDIENLMFGPKPSVRDYFWENSGGRLKIEVVGVLGWYSADKPADHYWNHPSTACAEGFLHGHVEKWAEAIRKAAKEFDFKAYDANNDNILSPDELAILIVIPQNNPFGTNRNVAGRESPNWEPLIVDGVRIDVMCEAYIGSPPSLGLVAHELAHLILRLGDMYFVDLPNYPYAAGPFSLMDQSLGHIDPANKMKLGWIVPEIISLDGWHNIHDIETNGKVLILYDPLKGNMEYFILENRWPGNSYDSNQPDAGLGIWHVIDDQNTLNKLPPPSGGVGPTKWYVDPVKWAKLPKNDWSRVGIRMIKPIYGPQFTWAKSLWDGSDPETGYDLLPSDPDPIHATLKWGDGTSTVFAVKSISIAGNQMNMYVKVL